MNRTRCSLMLCVLLAGAAAARGQQASRSVAEFLPQGFVRDGSVSYQQQVQRAIDAAAAAGQPLAFPAMTYAVDEHGWQLPSGSKLHMEGAVFEVRSDAAADGAVFHGHDVAHVTLDGGAIVGHNESWPDGVNVRGVHLTGCSASVAIRGMQFRNLSSNGIGIFGDQEHLRATCGCATW